MQWGYLPSSLKSGDISPNGVVTARLSLLVASVRRYRKRSAFTLVELLTVVAVIGVLAAIIVPVVGRAIQRGQQTSGQGLMREIGLAVHLFANDHHGRLPGGLWPGQVAEVDPERTGRLVHVISRYMGYPEVSKPTVIEEFGPPAFWQAVESGREGSTRVYVLQEQIRIDEVDYRPFGDMPPPGGPSGPPSGRPPRPPPPPPLGMHKQQIFALFSDSWMLSDCDRKHPSVTHKPWADSTLPEPFHENTRNTLYFDGRVEVVAVD